MSVPVMPVVRLSRLLRSFTWTQVRSSAPTTTLTALRSLASRSAGGTGSGSAAGAAAAASGGDGEGGEERESAEEITLKSTEILEGLGQNIVGSMRRPKRVDRSKEKDRRIPVSLAASLRYMESRAYEETYRGHRVWQLFRRNFGGQFHRPPFNVRISCVGEDGFIKYGQACPICRDEYLVIHHQNVKLLQQFISPVTAQVLPPRKTNLCQKKHEELLVAIHKARDYGTLTFYIPPRLFDWHSYYLPEQIAHLTIESDADFEKEDPVLQKALEDHDFGSHHEYQMENFP